MARDLDSLRASNLMDPAMKEALRQRPFFKEPSDFFEARETRAAHLRKLRHLMPVPGPIPDVCTEKELMVPVRDGHRIRVVQYAPVRTPARTPPLIVLFHEGGWSVGDLSDEEFNARLFVRELGAVCLNVEYRLAPEHVFPTWIHDSWDVLQWAAKNASSLGADPAQGFIVGGSSAGGNISAVLAHLSRTERLNPPVTGQWLSVPYLIPSMHVPVKYQAEYISMTENLDDPVLTGGLNDQPNGHIPSITKPDLTSPLVSVVAKEIYPPSAETENDHEMPMAKAFFQVAGMDPLRDHALIYDRILREEYGVETRLELYAGFGHMFWTNWPDLDISQQFARDLIEGFRWLLA